MTTLEAIYENGIFKPVTTVPETLKEKEHVRLTVETDSELELLSEFAEWEAASDLDIARFEKKLGERL